MKKCSSLRHEKHSSSLEAQQCQQKLSRNLWNPIKGLQFHYLAENIRGKSAGGRLSTFSMSAFTWILQHQFKIFLILFLVRDGLYTHSYVVYVGVCPLFSEQSTKPLPHIICRIGVPDSCSISRACYPSLLPFLWFM